MNDTNQLQMDTQRLVELVKAELDREMPYSRNWVVAEGERALENALAFSRAVANNSARELLAGATVREFIGVTWVDLCDEVYQQCEQTQRHFSANAS